jgi:hypothetical protein
MSVPVPHRLREVCICDRLITMEARIIAGAVRRVQGHTYTYRDLYVSIVETTVQDAVAAIKAVGEK